MFESINSMMLVALPLVAVLISLTIHEFCHGATAKYFGDDTAEVMGRLTLNPIAHIDPFGTLLLPIMLVFLGFPAFGWAKPVPVNPYNLRDPKKHSGIVAAAGPISNFVILIISGILVKILMPQLGGENLLIYFLYSMVIINVVLMVFNLIPIPPLDGSKVLFSLLPDKYNEFKHKLSINGPWILMAIILLDSFLNLGILSTLFNWVFMLVDLFI